MILDVPPIPQSIYNQCVLVGCDFFSLEIVFKFYTVLVKFRGNKIEEITKELEKPIKDWFYKIIQLSLEANSDQQEDFTFGGFDDFDCQKIEYYICERKVQFHNGRNFKYDSVEERPFKVFEDSCLSHLAQ
jgi:hypothetical protein